MIDSRDIKELHPTLQRAATELVKRMRDKGYAVGISSTYRDNERQTQIYNQGRTTPGNIISGAKAGQSIHNYRLAFDIFKNVKGQEYSDSNFFTTGGKIWTEMGGVWGGNWTGFIDRPHFEFTNGLTWQQLQAGKTLPQDFKMKWETTQVTQVNVEIKTAIDKLVKHGVVSSPDYWTNNYGKLKYLDQLIINMAKKLG